ncbi:sodium:solute symporter [Marinilabiliaceae bacterium ANBcel2]|nr:sodium:solute symporter [Marinilabiliaceae bacterium ANBcel2]
MDATTTIIIIALYFGVLFIISAVTGRKADNNSFFLGNKNSPWYIVSIGMVGSSISGVTFISVPGWVESQQFSYLQMVAGFFAGYVIIANILLPLYYKHNVTSIYSYLEKRFGKTSHKSGALLFIASKTSGSAARLYLVAGVLHIAIAEQFNIPFYQTVIITISLVWLYTFKGGIKTIVWTDALQTILLLSAAAITIFHISSSLNLNFFSIVTTIRESDYSKIFIFDWSSSSHFIKHFLAGAFIPIVMTGLDQDMMQKNLTIKELKKAQKNMYWYGAAFLPVNLLFLSLGALLFIYINEMGITAPQRADDVFPALALGGYLPPAVSILFLLGLTAAAYSSTDSALTSLTTSFSIDILKTDLMTKKRAKKTRIAVHIGFTILIAVVILIFRALNQDSVIDIIYTLAGYTYGPLLGLFSFALLTKYNIKERFVPVAVIVPPLVTGVIDFNSYSWFGINMGYEILILNGAITFLILWLIKKRVTLL